MSCGLLRTHSAANSISRLEDRHPDAILDKNVCASQPGDTGPDDANMRYPVHQEAIVQTGQDYGGLQSIRRPGLMRAKKYTLTNREQWPLRSLRSLRQAVSIHVPVSLALHISVTAQGNRIPISARRETN